MSKDDKRITRGRFAGKKITFASTERIDGFTQLASDFMGQVFDLLPGEYLIRDESDLLDFTEMGSADFAPRHAGHQKARRPLWRQAGVRALPL